jgi:hypothetical protein
MFFTYVAASTLLAPMFLSAMFTYTAVSPLALLRPSACYAHIYHCSTLLRYTLLSPLCYICCCLHTP